MKKFLTKIMAVVMAVGMLPAIPAGATQSYEGLDPNYDYTFSGWGINGTLTDDVYMEVQPNAGRSGNGLVCHFAEGQTGKTACAQSFSTLPAGDYRCTYWAKGTGTLWKFAVTPWFIASTGGNFYLYGGTESGNKEGAWYEYSYTFTLDGVKTNPTFQVFMEGPADVIVDDVQLYQIEKAEDGTETVKSGNLIVNGGFEYTGKPNVTETANDAVISNWYESLQNLADYNAFVIPSDKIGYDDNNSMYVYGDYRWKSGESKKINIISDQMNFDNTKEYTVSFYVNAKSGLGDTGVYIEGTGEFARMSAMKTGEVDNRGWEKLSYTLTPKASGNKRLGFDFYSIPDMYIDNVSVVCNDNPDVNLIKNGSFTTYYFPVSGIEDNDMVVNEWYTTYTALDDYTAYDAVADDFGYDDNSSLYFYGDYSWVSGENKYINFRSLPVYFQNGKKYNFSCYVNEVGSTIGNTHVSLDGAANAIMNNMEKGTADHSGWKKISHTFTATSDGYKSLRFLFYSNPNMYIDNIFIASEDAPEVNLVGNGSFTEITDTPVKAVNNVTADNWTVQANGEAISNKFEDTVFAEPSKTFAKSGENSMLFAFPDARTSGTYLNTVYPVNLAEGEYTLTFYAKGSYEPSGMQIVFRQPEGGAFAEMIRGDGGNPNDMSIKNISYVDGWRKYEFNVNVKGARNGFSIICDNRIDSLYIDDISITKGNVEYMTNGGFENVSAVNVTDVENLMAYPVSAGGAINVSWVNPKNDDIELKLFVNDELVEDFTYDATSKAFNEYLVKGLSNWQTYRVKLEISVDGGEAKAFETKAIPRAGAMKINNWTFSRGDRENSEGVMNYGNVTAEIVRTTGYNSNSSIFINSNRNGVLSNNYGQLVQGVSIDGTYPHEFKFKAKPDGLRSQDSLYTIFDYGAGSIWLHMYQDSDLVDVTIGEPDENGWVEYSYVIEPFASGEAAVNFRIGFANWADSIYIDNVELYQLDKNEYTITGSNLITDGGFEFPDVVLGELKVDYYNEEAEAWISDIDKMWGAGQYRASVSVGNISEPTALHVTAILAVYDSTGKLISATPAVQYVVQNQWATTGVTATADVPAGCYVKAMLWKGNDWSMVPMTSSVEVLNK